MTEYESIHLTEYSVSGPVSFFSWFISSPEALLWNSLTFTTECQGGNITNKHFYGELQENKSCLALILTRTIYPETCMYYKSAFIPSKLLIFWRQLSYAFLFLCHPFSFISLFFLLVCLPPPSEPLAAVLTNLWRPLERPLSTQDQMTCDKMTAAPWSPCWVSASVLLAVLLQLHWLQAAASSSSSAAAAWTQPGPRLQLSHAGTVDTSWATAPSTITMSPC